MNEVELFSGLLLKIADTGGPVVAVVLLMFLFIKPKLAEILSIVLGISRKDETHSKELPDIMLSTMELNKQISELLDAFRRRINASRIYIFSYHNGGHSISGLNFIRASCTHELVSLGTRPQQMLLQNLPITMFCAFNQKVLNKDGVRCEDISCFAENDPSTYETLKMQGIKSIYCVGLYSGSGTPIGFLGVDYCDKNTEMSDSGFYELESLGIRVSSLMCLTDNRNPLCSIQE